MRQSIKVLMWRPVVRYPVIAAAWLAVGTVLVASPWAYAWLIYAFASVFGF